jgi:hypothetical protein
MYGIPRSKEYIGKKFEKLTVLKLIRNGEEKLKKKRETKISAGSRSWDVGFWGYWFKISATCILKSV